MPRLGPLALALAALTASAQPPVPLGDDRLDVDGVSEAGQSLPVAPATFAFQGVLEDGGAPIADGTHAIRISLYASSNGLLPLYAENH